MTLLQVYVEPSQVFYTAAHSCEQHDDDSVVVVVAIIVVIVDDNSRLPKKQKCFKKQKLLIYLLDVIAPQPLSLQTPPLGNSFSLLDPDGGVLAEALLDALDDDIERPG